MATRSLLIVITGASRGLGAGMARTLAARGHRLGLCSRSPATADLATSDDGKVYYQSGVDVSDPDAVRGFLDHVVTHFGGDNTMIDLWINNAGIVEPIRPIRDTEVKDFEKNIRVNLMGVFHPTQAYIRHVRSHHDGRGSDDTTTTATLVNISSGAATKGYAGWGAYCSAKAAVDRLTECAVLEEQQDDSSSDYRFRAYSVAPGVVDTDMQATIRSASQEDFPMLDRFLQLKADDAFNTPPYVAREIEALALAVGPQKLPVVRRLDNETTAST